MEHPDVLCRGDEAYDRIQGFFETEPFRESIQGGGYIHEWISRLSSHPVGLCAPGSEFERNHVFWPWMRTIPLPSLGSPPIVRDITLLHDVVHVAAMRYPEDEAGSTEVAFEERMRDNAFSANWHSNVWVFFELDNVRQLHPVGSKWVDRYLYDQERVDVSSTNASLFKSQPAELLRGLLFKRLQAVLLPRDRQEEKIQLLDGVSTPFARALSSVAGNIDTAMCTVLGEPDGAASARMLEEWFHREMHDGAPPTAICLSSMQAKNGQIVTILIQMSVGAMSAK